MRRNNLTGSKQQHNTAHLEASGKQAQSGCSPFLNTDSSWTGLYGFPKRSQAHKKPGALRLLNWFSLGFRADSTF